jgi:hypothetical protein
MPWQGHRNRGRVREPITRSDDEGVERVLRIEPGLAIIRPARRAVGQLNRAVTRRRGPVVVVHVESIEGRRPGQARLWYRLGLLVGVLHGDRDADLAADFGGERRGDQRAQPVFEVVLGELVRRGEQCRVLDQSERAGKSDPRSVMRADCVVVEASDRTCPDIAEVAGVVHLPSSSPHARWSSLFGGRHRPSHARSCAVRRPGAKRLDATAQSTTSSTDCVWNTATAATAARRSQHAPRIEWHGR